MVELGVIIYCDCLQVELGVIIYYDPNSAKPATLSLNNKLTIGIYKIIIFKP